MPSEKRARQRALRAQKQAVIQQQRNRRRLLRRSLWGALLVAAVIGIAILLSNNASKSGAKATSTSSSSSSSTSTSTSTSTSVTGTTFAPPTTLPLQTTAVVPTCPPTTGSKTRVVFFKTAPPKCISSSSVWDATFGTDEGPFTVQMVAAKSYAAVNNFVFLALWQYYNGTYFHRVIPGFVVQGGDPTGTGSGGPHAYPGYSFTGNYPPESCTTKPTQPACYHVGDFVMANSNSAQGTQNASTDGSQFFVVLPGGETTLNGEPTYTNFGKVISGMNVVEKIGALGSQSGTPTVKVYVLKVTVKQVKA